MVFSPWRETSVGNWKRGRCLAITITSSRAAIQTPKTWGTFCTTCTECPDGSCSHQCFCPVGPPGAKERPNECDTACLGGANDANGCTADSECPGGFCHNSDCRDAAGACQGGTNGRVSCTVDSECPGGTCGDPDGAGEGACSAGPLDSFCSVNTEKPCNVLNGDADCDPSACPFCQPGETCVFKFRECFVNSGIVRTGVADPDDPTAVSVFCIRGTGTSAVDEVAGLPGPGALRSAQTVVRTGF